MTPPPEDGPAASAPLPAAAADEAHDMPEPASATHAAEDEAWTPPLDEATRLAARVAELEAQAAALQSELEATRDRALRARADYENLQRRTQNERAEQAQLAAARIIGSLVEPLEVLERAAADAEAAADPRAHGVRLAHRGLRAVLEREGLEDVPGVGARFDPRLHEAVAREPDASAEGTVLAVVRPGYRLHGRLLRAALVKVSSGPA